MKGAFENMANINVSLQVLPSVPEERVYPVVDKVIEMIKESGVKYEVGPMGQLWKGLRHSFRNCQKGTKICTRRGKRVVSVVKID